jgi:hypothetical protein
MTGSSYKPEIRGYAKACEKKEFSIIPEYCNGVLATLVFVGW